MTKCVTQKNVVDLDVAKGICYNVSSNLIIDSDRVVVQIAESFSKEDMPSD